MSEQMQPVLFTEIAKVIPDPSPNPCAYPYFIVAYWPKGGWWKLFDEGFSEPEGATRKIEKLRQSGWIRITLLKLPDELWKP